MTFPENEIVSEITGVEITGEYTEGGTTLADVRSIFARPYFYDKNGKALIYENSIGKGKVFFGIFKDYFTKEPYINYVTDFMEQWGRKGGTYCDNNNVYFVKRKDGEKIRYDFLNLNCAADKTETFTLTDGDIVLSGEVKPGECLNLSGR